MQNFFISFFSSSSGQKAGDSDRRAATSCSPPSPRDKPGETSPSHLPPPSLAPPSPFLFLRANPPETLNLATRPPPSIPNRRRPTGARAPSPCLAAPSRRNLRPGASDTCWEGLNTKMGHGVPNASRRRRHARHRFRPPELESTPPIAPPRSPLYPCRVERAGMAANAGNRRLLPRGR